MGAVKTAPHSLQWLLSTDRNGVKQMGKVKGKKKNKRPEYVVICREFNRAEARIEISVIDSGVTDHLMNNLIKMHMRDPHKRYFLTLKKDYQVYGALFRKQIETMSIKNNKRIVELGVELDGNENDKNQDIL